LRSSNRNVTAIHSLSVEASLRDYVLGKRYFSFLITLEHLDELVNQYN